MPIPFMSLPANVLMHAVDAVRLKPGSRQTRASLLWEPKWPQPCSTPLLPVTTGGLLLARSARKAGRAAGAHLIWT